MFHMALTEVKGKHLKDVLPEIPISEQLHIGLRRTIKDLPVIINQMPIIENDEQIGSSFAFLDTSDMEKMALELEIVKDLQTTINGVLSASSDGVFISDTSGVIKYINERACQLLDQTSEQTIGKPIQDLLQTNSPVEIAKSGLLRWIPVILTVKNVSFHISRSKRVTVKTRDLRYREHCLSERQCGDRRNSKEMVLFKPANGILPR